MRYLFVFISSLCHFSPTLVAAEVTPQIPSGLDRPFVSGEVWTKPMEDWRLQDGKIVNTISGGNRSVVSLTSSLTGNGDFKISATVEQRSPKLSAKGFVGFQLGLQGASGPESDYREATIYGVGLPVGILANGKLFIGTPDPAAPVLKSRQGPFEMSVSGSSTEMTLQVGDLSYKKTGIHPGWTEGLVALTASSQPLRRIDLKKPRPQVSLGGANFGRLKSETDRLKPLNQRRAGEARFAFSNWKLSGSAIQSHPERTFGPIWWSTYTVHSDKKLRLLVQMAPVSGDVILNIGGAETTASIDPISYTAHFEIPLLQSAQENYYSIKYQDHLMRGIIRAIPQKDQALKIASLSCNDSTGFPHTLLEKNVSDHKPDVITFHGDQIYEGIGGYGFLSSQEPDPRANLCYLRKYAMHGWTWRKLLMTTPSITIPDDHDVMHGNIWGAGGKLTSTEGTNSEKQDSGGYKMSPEFVNMVHRTQTGNLPIPKNQPLAKNGITTYFTSWKYGPLDFAIIADRQFKSAPKSHFPEAQINNGWPQNLAWNPKTQSLKEGLELLGPLQENFLSKWAEQQSPFKILISQSPFLAPQTLPVEMYHDKNVPQLPVYKKGDYAPNDEPKPDFDTNGWPQDKQKVALKLLKKADAIHIVGDQHLGTTGQYGIDNYQDGTWWIATPAIANVWPRRWMPKIAPKNPKPDWPRWLGGFEDGFGNKFTLHAVSNPWDIDREPSRLFDRAVGYAITTYDAKTKQITLANWPYTSGPKDQPYEGWPITIQK